MEPLRKLKTPAVQFGPFVDEANMNFFGDTTGRSGLVYGDYGFSGNGPVAHIDPHSIRIPKREPIIDLYSSSVRWKVLTFEGGRVGVLGVFGAALMHVLLVAIAVAVSVFNPSTTHLLTEEVPVEVSFGFGFEPRRTETAPDDKKTEAEVEALKTAEQLPQMAKNMAIEAPPPDAKSMPLPEPVKPVVVEPVKKETKVDNTAKAEAVQKNPLKIDRTPPPGVKTVSPEEYAKRLERENRKVGEKEQKGTRVDPDAGKNQAKSEIPPDPFAAKSIPDAPAGLGPAGSIDGQKVSLSARNDYAASATSHIRRYWQSSDFQNFELNLQVVVSFRVNAFGRILGKAKVEKSSGNSLFDDEALQAVEAAVPFPELPEELSPSMPMRMKFSPRDIKI